MAQLVTANIYGMNMGTWIYSNMMSFPTQSILLSVPHPLPLMQGLYMLSVIKALGVNGQPEYFTDKSQAQLATEANT